MAGEKEGWWSHVSSGALTTLAGTVTTGVTLWLWDWLRNELLSALKGIWWHLFQSYTLQMWTLYLLAIPSIAFTVFCAIWLIRSRKFSHRRFTQLSLFGALWRWTYDISGRPMQLGAFCRNCDMRLVFVCPPSRYIDDPISTTYHCESCGSRSNSFDGYPDDANGRVLREIERLTRTGEWRTLDVKPSGGG